jgi:hypothetical protein
MDRVRGVGRAIFAAVLLMIGGVLNIIYGIAAIGNSKFFAHDTPPRPALPPTGPRVL